MKAMISSIFAALASAMSPTAVSATTSVTDAPSSQFERFVPSGARIIDTIKSSTPDIDHLEAILVVETPSTKEEESYPGAKRQVIILSKNKDGELVAVARGLGVVPCSQCGGLLGDPYGSIDIADGNLSVTTSGGSRERWMNVFTFRFSPGDQTWLLNKSLQFVSDQVTQRFGKLEQSASEFGRITFSEFDSSAMPGVEYE